MRITLSTGIKSLAVIGFLLITAGLMACDAGSHKEQQTIPHEVLGDAFYYSYPLQGQVDVAPYAPIVLAFLKPVAVAEGDVWLESEQGERIEHFAINATDGGKGVFLLPLDENNEQRRLSTNTRYTIHSNKFALPAGGITFTVRPALSGALDERNTRADFSVSEVSPDGKAFQLIDFSSINITLTQPMDEKTATYGESGSIRLLQQGKLVQATLYAKGRYITIDPDGDLKAGEPVTLVVSDQLKNRRGESLTSLSYSMVPANSYPRETTVMRAQAPDTCDATQVDVAFVSPLTQKPINCVPLISRLLGGTVDSPSSVSTVAGNVFGELAFAPRFPHSTPLRLKRGAMLEGDSLEIKIGGEVSVGFTSGDLRATIITDANGYIFDNPYTDNPEAPKYMQLTADMAFDTEDPRANGAFSQTVMHATLLGKAIVDTKTGELIGDAIAVVEPSVLGVERAFGIMSFRMASYPDQDNLPAGVPKQQPKDIRELKLSSWVPGDVKLKPKPDQIIRIDRMQLAEDERALGGPDNIADMLNPDDPVILNFNKPLDPLSIERDKSLQLTMNDEPVAFDWELNGTAVSIFPDPPLRFARDNSHPDIYKVSYQGITDLDGNEATPQELVFRMPLYVEGDSNPYDAIISSVYPGFPCVTAPESLDLANESQGYCESHPADGVNDPSDNGSISNGKNNMAGEPVDELPILAVPANRELRTRFSQPMDKSSFDEGFLVQQCESLLQCDNPITVAGERDVFGKTLVFTPRLPWQEGVLYRQIFKGKELATTLGGHLITATLNSKENNGRYADLVIYFYGAKHSQNAFKGLRNLPTSDLNGNFRHDDGEPEISADADPGVSRTKFNSVSFNIAGTDGLVVTSAVPVCPDTAPNCQDPGFAYITLSLNAEWAGFKTPDEVKQVEEESGIEAPELVKQKGGLLAYIFPSQLVTSSLTLDATVLGIINKQLATDMMVLRIRYTCDAKDGGCKNDPMRGLIPAWSYNDENGDAVISITLNAYFDAPLVAPVVTTGDVPGLGDATQPLSDVLEGLGLGSLLGSITGALGLGDNPTVGALLGGLDGGVPITTDMHAKKLGPILARGPVNIMADGRLQVELLNAFDETVSASVDVGGVLGTLGIGGENGIGSIDIEIPSHKLDANFIASPIVY